MEEQLTKTAAKNDYYLTEKDLLGCDNTPVSRYRTYYVLYKKSDIITIFCTKYNINDDCILQKQQELANKKLIRANKKLIKAQETKIKHKELKITRREELINALNKKGLELREDSNLCKLYVKQDKDIVKEWTLDEVVERMCQMKYLYESQKEEKSQGFYPDRTIAEQAEMEALYAHNKGKWPTVWPWLSNTF